MNLIEKIRQKPQEEKIKIIWLAVLIAAALLAALWAVTAKISKSTPKDISLFQTLGKGFKDIRDNYKK